MASLYIYGWDGVDCMRSLTLTNSDESLSIATIATDSAVLIIKQTDSNTRKIQCYTRDNSFHILCLLNVLKDCLAIVQEGDDVVVGSGDSIAACATTRYRIHYIFIIIHYNLAYLSCLLFMCWCLERLLFLTAILKTHSPLLV